MENTNAKNTQVDIALSIDSSTRPSLQSLQDLEAAAAPPPLEHRIRDECGHFADAAGSLPRNPVINNCPFGTAQGNTLALWGVNRLPSSAPSYQGTGRAKINEWIGAEFVYDSGSSYAKFPRVCVIGPDWPCLCVTFGLIIAPSLAWFIGLAPRVNIGLLISGVFTFISLIVILAILAGSDPGIVPKQTPQMLQLQMEKIKREAEERSQKATGAAYRPGAAGSSALSRYSTCNMCNVLRVSGTSHCYDCNVCIIELDHHCPWTGKCIGRGNILFFNAFLASLTIHAGLVMASTVAFFTVSGVERK